MGTEAPASAPATITQRAVCHGYARSYDAGCSRSAPARVRRRASTAGSRVPSSLVSSLSTADMLAAPSRTFGAVGRSLRRAGLLFPGGTTGSVDGAGDSPATRAAFVRLLAGRRSEGEITVARCSPISSADALRVSCAARMARYSEGVGRRSPAVSGSITPCGVWGVAGRSAGSLGRGASNSMRSCSNRAHIGHAPTRSRANS